MFFVVELGDNHLKYNINLFLYALIILKSFQLIIEEVILKLSLM